MNPLLAELKTILSVQTTVSAPTVRETALEHAPLSVWVDCARDLVELSGVGGFKIGTIRKWAGGVAMQKVAPGKWVPVPGSARKTAGAVPVGTGAASAAAPAAAAPAAPKAPDVPMTGMNVLLKEPTTPIPAGAPKAATDPMVDRDKDGITDSARVGVCGKCVVPPGKIPRLPNLTAEERAAESRFADAYEADPDAMVKAYRDKLASREIGDAPNVFATDDVKLLSPDYNPEGDKDAIMEGRANFNTATHQTANAVAKRAFVQRLDELAKLPPDDPQRTVLITSGGVASGKGYALGNVKEASDLVKQVGAVWDAAGEQNATENPWVAEELKKRGLKGVFVFVDSDPSTRWENPKLGVVERAKKVGRMVDARLFADSYAIGAKNFQAFQNAMKDDPDMTTMILSSRTNPPSRASEVSKESMDLDADKIYERASKVIDDQEDLPARVRRGASTGRRVWGPPGQAKAESRRFGFNRVALEAALKPDPKATVPELTKDAYKKLGDQLLKNLTKYLEDPTALEAEKDARDFKAKALKILKSK